MAAQQIIPPGYGEPNFKPSLRERARKKPSLQERREGNCEQHASLIRALPCCVTGITPAGTIHHLKSGPASKERGMGMKAPDWWGVPLCEDAHLNGVERVGTRNEFSWFQAHGIADVYELAAALWSNTGDVDRMAKIVRAHMGRPAR